MADYTRELEQLKATVQRHIDTPEEDRRQLTTAVRALIYLRDPYDALMDQHLDLGLEDDLEVIRSAARELGSDQPVNA